MPTVRELSARLTVDQWRLKTGYSAEVDQTTVELLDTSKSDGQLGLVLRRWLNRHQPCLFGRLASAASDKISFCFLREWDLVENDRVIKDKIQEARQKWKRDAFRGRKSAFVLLAVAPGLVAAAPDERLLALAQRLCKLYLRRDVQPDAIYMDRLAIELDRNGAREEWEWDVGVNFFGVQADGRWWNDHRIPGGIGFSTNSVGHLVQSTNDAHLIEPLTRANALPARHGVTSLEVALKMAMLTIHGAQESPSGKATWLVELEDSNATPSCPFPRNALPATLQGKDHRGYRGWYHTDHTIPHDYFSPDVKRPQHVAPLNLDFTYLFDEDLENDAFETMGRGVRVR